MGEQSLVGLLRLTIDGYDGQGAWSARDDLEQPVVHLGQGAETTAAFQQRRRIAVRSSLGGRSPPGEAGPGAAQASPGLGNRWDGTGNVGHMVRMVTQVTWVSARVIA